MWRPVGEGRTAGAHMEAAPGCRRVPNCSLLRIRPRSSGNPVKHAIRLSATTQSAMLQVAWRLFIAKHPN
ncbi:hypothetical protein GCM10023107_37420 [Actinoplanes octamycinicus]|nr:hypothetical protein Aoc01nite_30620 [Actinoplanes octamycinicus]